MGCAMRLIRACVEPDNLCFSGTLNPYMLIKEPVGVVLDEDQNKGQDKGQGSSIDVR